MDFENSSMIEIVETMRMIQVSEIQIGNNTLNAETFLIELNFNCVAIYFHELSLFFGSHEKWECLQVCIGVCVLVYEWLRRESRIVKLLKL